MRGLDFHFSKGEDVIITARGLWCHEYRGAETQLYGPDGFARTGGSNTALPGANIGALVARINNGEPFLVGSGKKIFIPADGIIEFTMNDIIGQYSNNVGKMIVKVDKAPSNH